MWWRKHKQVEIPAWIESVQEKLERLRLKDATFARFGAFKHQYQLGAPLSKQELADAERWYQIQLPQDYREFLLYLGNGGAGPGYGLNRFGVLKTPIVNRAPRREIVVEDKSSTSTYSTWAFEESFYDEMENLRLDPSSLQRPFPLTHAWQMPSEDVSEDDDELDHWWTQTVDPIFSDGQFELCHHGCGQKDKLIVCGEEAGAVWCFDEQDMESVAPYGYSLLSEQVPKRRCSFRKWYEDWLCDTL